MTADGSARYGIYFAPHEDSALWRTACAWLGRDPAADVSVDRPLVAWAEDEDARAATESPRHYGFHATLKAPFALAAGSKEETLTAELDAFATRCKPFALPLTVGVLDGFLALRPAEPSYPLQALADACVETFDPFRAPASADELARRRKNGLTPQQHEMLERWGYPYVFETYRFHMTLTGRLDEPRHAVFREGLADLFATALADPVMVDSICLFAQPSRRHPFRLIRRHTFGESR